MFKKSMMVALAVLGTSFTGLVSADSVVVNGDSYSCTNKCKVTTLPGGGYSVEDCCGGSVTVEDGPVGP